MPLPPNSETMSRSWTRSDAAAIVLLAIVVILYQFAAGAYSGDIARYSELWASRSETCLSREAMSPCLYS